MSGSTSFTDYVGRLGNEQEAELFEAEKSLLADKELEQPTCESDVAKESMSAMVKLAKGSAWSPTTSTSRRAEWERRAPTRARAEQKTPMSVSRCRTPRCARRVKSERKDMTSNASLCRRMMRLRAF